MKVKLRKMFISIFILFNLLMMVRVHLPLNTKFFSTIYKPIDGILSFFSIYQDWMMFAENPSRTSVYLEADVIFEDGSVFPFEFPQSKNLTYFEKYLFGERYRKIISESITRDHFKFAWNDIAKFVLRKIKKNNFQKIPVKVYLFKLWYEVPDYNVVFLPHLSNQENLKKDLFYIYEVF